MPVISTDKSSPPPISGGGEVKPHPPSDTNLAADLYPDESSKPASTERAVTETPPATDHEGAVMVTLPASTKGAAMVTPPKVTFSDIEKILGADFKLDTSGTPL